MKQSLKMPLAAVAISLGLTFSASADMQSRLDMIAALETTQDYDRLNELVAADYGLLEYYRVLQRAAAFHEDKDLVSRLLTLPSIDKNSSEFKRAVSGVYSYLGQFEEQDPEILKLLLEQFSDDQTYLDNSLSFIFQIVADPGYPEQPAPDAARMLIEEGADIDKAYSFQESGIQARIEVLEDVLRDMSDFKREVLSPN